MQGFDNIKTTKLSDSTCMPEGAGGNIGVSVGDDIKAKKVLKIIIPIKQVSSYANTKP